MTKKMICLLPILAMCVCLKAQVKEPDYVGLHKNGNIQYVKKLDDISLVGIQVIKGNNNLLFRTIFPISETKLNNSIRSGKLIPFIKK